ncbi:MAG TPA: hypothetical protein PK294_01945 [Ignavibacteria bacterium]|nr:hypothetical protein [Ignavibacteria bacterium]HRA99176.1 hypothetical protein [Ignavibacteria bacterium]
MALDKGKHNVKEIDGVRCTVIETGVSDERMTFLKNLLELNGLTVKTESESKKIESDPDTFIIGVTDIVFNPVIAVYQRKLRTHEGKIVTAPYWKQLTEESKGWYWK